MEWGGLSWDIVWYSGAVWGVRLGEVGVEWGWVGVGWNGFKSNGKLRWSEVEWGVGWGGMGGMGWARVV